MFKSCLGFLTKLSQGLFWDADFKNNAEFTRKYTIISLQREKVFSWVAFIICLYSLYLDMILNKSNTTDLVYRQTLTTVHLVALVLSFAYGIIYSILAKSQRYRFSRITKAVILSTMALSLLTGAVLSLNSQRFTGNTDAYVLVVLLLALIVPMYPKWMLGIYSVIHIFFLAALSTLHPDDSIIVKQFNTTAIVFVALVLFITLYRYNVRNFLYEETLQEGKSTFIKLFETNPFPLMISRLADGKIQYVNHKAMLFYEMTKEQAGALNHKDLYQNASDLDVIFQMIEMDGKVSEYAVEQKTLSGKIKRSIVNYELIDYFGEKSLLSGVTDITEIKRMEHELTIHASTDILTGVFNRRVGMDHVKKRYEAAKHENAAFTLCFIDIDNLKLVNDKFGHLEGDSLIMDVCRIIREEIQPNDTLFRYGGDEFIILFHDEDERKIEKTCHRIAERFEALNQSDYKPYPIDASMGTFSHKSGMNLDLEQIIETVDKKMYDNKQKKRTAS